MTAQQCEDLYIEIGLRIRSIRKAQGMSQDTLAELVELTRTSIVNIERGRQRAPLHVLQFIADALAVDLRELIPSEDRPARVVKQEKLPPGFARFVTSSKVHISAYDQRILSSISYRGKQPTTPERWMLLHEFIKLIVGGTR